MSFFVFRMHKIDRERRGETEEEKKRDAPVKSVRLCVASDAMSSKKLFEMDEKTFFLND